MATQAPANFKLGPPSPEGGWSSSIEVLQRAVLVPPVESSLTQACGVVDQSGGFCETAMTWRGKRPLIVPPDERVQPTAILEGRHLYAGQIWMHFGHFMAESLSRLWALDHLKEKPQSIVFIPKRPQREQDLKGYQEEFLQLLGIDIPITVVTEQTEVEELIVPGQGFGLGAIAAGTAEYRDYFANNFCTDVRPDGAESIYLSRSKLGGMEGGALLEERLEDNLTRDGYDILHPQNMRIRDQVARYRAAKRIVGLDGSAFHLFGFVGREHQRTGIILRRNSKVFESIAVQIGSFCGLRPKVFSAIAADWLPEHKSKPGRYSFGEIDFPILADLLHDEGFGPPPEDWSIPGFRDMKRAMAAFSKEKGVEFTRRKNPNRPKRNRTKADQ